MGRRNGELTSRSGHEPVRGPTREGIESMNIRIMCLGAALVAVGVCPPGCFSMKVGSPNSSQAELEELKRLRSTPYGQPLQGARIRIITTRFSLRKDDQVQFQLGIDYELEPEGAIGFRIPGEGPNGTRGIGNNVILEIDDKSIPMPDTEPKRLLFKCSRSSVTSTRIRLAEGYQLPPGEHTVRYTIISHGGTAKVGRETIPILKGKLVSNTFIFTIGQ